MSTAPRRTLAAVMFADMEGFTSLMARNESAARVLRDRQREVLSRLVPGFGGRVRQHYGDGALCIFPSAVEAARCAVAVQRELREQPAVPLRIGLHLGDIVDEDEGVYGDGVNVAARIQSLSAPGGIAVSDKLYDEVRNHPDLDAVSLGTPELKNVSRPVEVFAIRSHGLPVPEGPVAPSRRATSGSWARPAAIGLIAAAAAAVVLLSLPAGPEEAPSAASVRTTPSVAVLPFRNLSVDDEAGSFFADGLHDDILTQLAKVGSLEVIARTSVLRYAGTSRPIPEIARELGVAAVLEGGVQRAGNRVRLNVQLIDGRTNGHLWAETFDRELTMENVFAIQSEIADAITGALRAVLTAPERLALGTVPTESVEAYDRYLEGSTALRRGALRSNLQAAQTALESAVRADPDFTAAHARLAYTHLTWYWNALDRTAERLEAARASLERAEALDPDDPETLVARGYYSYWGYRDYPAAQDAFAAALRARPGDARIHAARGYVLRRTGRWREAVRDLEVAVGLDPLNAELIRELGQTHLLMREYAAAEGYLDRALAVDPLRVTASFDRAMLDVMRDGDLSRLSGLIAVEEGGAVTFARWWTAYLQGQDSLAMRVAAEVDEPLEQQTAVNPRTLLNALMHRASGRRAQAVAAADSARVELEALARAVPDDPRLHAALGTTYAILGRREEAIESAGRAVELLPIERDALDGPAYLLNQAEVLAILGERDAAADALVRLLSVPNDNSIVSVMLSPVLRELRDHPRVIALRQGTVGPADGG